MGMSKPNVEWGVRSPSGMVIQCQSEAEAARVRAWAEWVVQTRRKREAAAAQERQIRNARRIRTIYGEGGYLRE